ncbi:MAG: hypothetical protein GY953_23720 [bacterium]|nr:hypothetical protein [bacterium]
MRTISLFLSLAAAAVAFQPDYFPLRVGNQWVYTRGGLGAGGPVVVEVVDVDVFDHLPFALVRGFPSGNVWLRLEEDGRLLARDPDTGDISTWVAFDAALNEPFNTTIDPCNSTGSIVSREASLTGPVGEFTTALEVAYTPACADAGVVTDLFLPYVGLTRRTVTSIAGPRTWDLVYARLGGVTFVTEPSFSVGLSVNQVRFASGDEPGLLRARFNLRNVRLDPVTLTFPSSQRFDFIIRDSDGVEVYRWSDGRAFPQVITTETFAMEKNYAIETPLASGEIPFPPGTYTIEAQLTPLGPSTFSATAQFTILP